jgi:hypothetical protein
MSGFAIVRNSVTILQVSRRKAWLKASLRPSCVVRYWGQAAGAGYMRDRRIKDEPLCDQLKPFVTRNGWVNHPLIVEMPPWHAAQINRRFVKRAKLAEELWGKQEYRRYLRLHERAFRIGALEKILASSHQLVRARLSVGTRGYSDARPVVGVCVRSSVATFLEPPNNDLTTFMTPGLQ